MTRLEDLPPAEQLRKGLLVLRASHQRETWTHKRITEMLRLIPEGSTIIPPGKP